MEQGFMEKSARLQREAARLQKVMQRTVLGQMPSAAAGDISLDKTSSADRRMVLLKVRVFLKAVRENRKKAEALGMQVRSILEEGRASAADTPVMEERMRSLQATQALLTQMEAETKMLDAAYGELETALAQEDKVLDADRKIRLRRAEERARQIFSGTGNI